MPDPNDEVMAMVERSLRRQRGSVSTRKLKERAEAIDPAIRDLSIQQFHGRYPLQALRRLRKEQPEEGEGRIDRSSVRATLLDFARAVTAAEEPAEVITHVESVDQYVDRILEAGGMPGSS